MNGEETCGKGKTQKAREEEIRVLGQCIVTGVWINIVPPLFFLAPFGILILEDEAMLFLAMAGAVITVTISYSKLFEPVRKCIHNWFLHSLISCHFCMNFYVAAVLMVIKGGYHFDAGLLFHWLVLVFLMTLGSSLLIVCIGRSEKFCSGA